MSAIAFSHQNNNIDTYAPVTGIPDCSQTSMITHRDHEIARLITFIMSVYDWGECERAPP